MLIKTEDNGLLTGEQEFTDLAARLGMNPYKLMLAFEFGVHKREIFEQKCRECLAPIGRPHWSTQGLASYDVCGDVRHREMNKCSLDKGDVVTIYDMSEKAMAGRF